MTMPLRPLRVTLDIAEQNIGEIRFFDSLDRPLNNNGEFWKRYAVAARFLQRHSDWTWEELDEMTPEEVMGVINELFAKAKEKAIPLPSGGSSAPGPSENPAPSTSPDGASSSTMPPSSG